MTSLTLDRHKGRATYDIAQPGLNYRMDEMRAALGSVQLEKLSDGNKRRGELTYDIVKLLNSPVLIPFDDQPVNSISAYHILPILLPEGLDRLSVISALKERKFSRVFTTHFLGFFRIEGQFSKEDAPITAEICSEN